MATTPEAPAEAPKYSKEDLHDPAKRAAALLDYAAVGTMTSAELDEKIKQGMADGLFKRNAGDDIRLDDTFDGAELIATTPDVPEVQDLLAQMKDRKMTTMRDERFDRMNTDLLTVNPDQMGDHLAFMLEEAFRRGEIDVTEGKATRGIPATDPEMKPADRKQLATKQAFESVLAGLDADEQDKFQAGLKKLAKRKPEIARDELNRKTRAQQKLNQEARDRADAARAKAEAAYKATADRKAATEKILKLGLHRVTYNVGDILPDGSVATRETHMTEDSIHEEALQEDSQRNLERQLGSEGAAKELERRKKQAELDKKIGGAQAAAAATGEDVSNFGPSGARREADVATAEAEAYAVDREAREVLEIRDYYQRMIDQEPDMRMKQALEKTRDAAINEEKERQENLTKEAAQRRAETLKAMSQVQIDARAGKATESKVDSSDRNVEDAAMVRRQALGLEPIPFLEVKQGGLVHWNADKRGPKVVESYFRVPGNDNIVVVERRNRRTGELISQLTLTTEQPIRRRRGAGGEITLPPREAEEKMAELRKADRDRMVATSGSSLGSRSLGDFYNVGFGTGTAIDGDNGVYARYNPDQSPAGRANMNSRLSTFKYGSKRRGGFFYSLGIFQ